MGPAVESPENVAALIDAGMSVARLNLSHGTYDEHAKRFALVRQASAAAQRPVDTCGSSRPEDSTREI